MSAKASLKKPSSRCAHPTLSFASSHVAELVGYKRPTPQQRSAAVTPLGSTKGISQSGSAVPVGTFPAPLLLPDDDLALDPSHPPQSFRSWVREKDRNKITPEQRTIYLAVPPGIGPDVDFIKKWSHPRQKDGPEIERPDVKDVLGYLEAFYYGLPIKMMPSDIFSFTSQVDDLDDIPTVEKGIPGRRIIGLKTQIASACKGIRTRATPSGTFTHQMNLDDLLDAAIWSLPEDAYALILLVDHDLYEDADDLFVCGRAYGGSRVAVISTARYNPGLDLEQGVEREHAWPASHCKAYLQKCFDDADPPTKQKKVKSGKSSQTTEPESSSSNTSTINSPLYMAVSAHNSLPSLEASPTVAILSGLWLGRVCRTVSHELGHCFGIEHCVYYACFMQGSASIIEDARQPPYLCPVDLAKVLKATGANMKERYKTLIEFCDQHRDIHLFTAYASWIRGRLEEMKDD